MTLSDKKECIEKIVEAILFIDGVSNQAQTLRGQLNNYSAEDIAVAIADTEYQDIDAIMTKLESFE